jgi:hypothetical protein
VAANDVPWGCRLEDGTVLIAAPGEGFDPIVSVDHRQGRPPPVVQAPTSLRPTGNAIDVDVRIGGRLVGIVAEDFVVISADLRSIVSASLHRVVVDGEDVTEAAVAGRGLLDSAGQGR